MVATKQSRRMGNPKSQAQNPKQYPSTKYNWPKQFRDLNFDIRICPDFDADAQ